VADKGTRLKERILRNVSGFLLREYRGINRGCDYSSGELPRQEKSHKDLSTMLLTSLVSPPWLTSRDVRPQPLTRLAVSLSFILHPSSFILHPLPNRL